MRILGCDFTSRPTPRKPIICAACVAGNGTLLVDSFVSLDSLEMFANFLASQGPWVAGLDFPFGQPRVLVEALGWPRGWPDYVAEAAALPAGGFERRVQAFREARPRGERHPLRVTDRLAGARSPLMLHGVPVGKMFLRGAPLLLQAPASVLPCRPAGDARVVLEAYPAVVARRLIGRRSYKGEGRRHTPARRRARAELVAALGSETLRAAYGLALRLPPAMAREVAEEPAADHLDALLCALQAAWAWSRHETGWGIPAQADPGEGWIVDPLLLESAAARGSG